MEARDLLAEAVKRRQAALDEVERRAQRLRGTRLMADGNLQYGRKHFQYPRDALRWYLPKAEYAALVRRVEEAESAIAAAAAALAEEVD